jgi:putative peptidoglycan lipid II flippase
VDRKDGGDVISGWKIHLQSVPGATLALIVMGILTRFVTLLTQMVIAREFGLSVFSDAYFATENIPEHFLEFVAIGFSMVFIPMFTGYRINRGEHEAWKFASSFFFLSSAVSIVFAVIAALGAPLLISLIAPGFQGLARQIAIRLVRIMSLSILFLGLDSGIRGLLQSHREFIIPELARLVYNSVLFVFAISLSARFGVFVLAWGIVFGAALGLVIQFLGAAKKGVLKLVWAFDFDGVRQAAQRLLPFLIAISGVSVMFTLNRMMASGLPEGSIATLNYAGRLILLPVGIFALPLRTTLYPELSALAARSQIAEFAETMLSGVKILLFVVIPACVGLVVLHTPLTRLFFEGGAFDQSDTLATSKALIFYAGGVPAIALMFLLINVYLSLGQALSLAKLNIVNWLMNLGLGLILSRYLGPYGIALGTSISVTLTVILLIYFLKRDQLKTLNLKSLLSSVYKISLVSGVMGLLLLLLMGVSSHTLVQLPLHLQLLQIVVLALIGAFTYLIIGRCFKLDELMMLRTAFRRT